ncbi:flagella basal body P-ring formation protein FlgA, partial [Candidatus Paracaedibacter symbiosus]|uniref:flagella basal body P-ring formation protein FlgA n=1 Tax=Candidatus Paracaedibacter symbiosus TaxID=244582 RepID=UPI00068FDFA6
MLLRSLALVVSATVLPARAADVSVADRLVDAARAVLESKAEGMVGEWVFEVDRHPLQSAQHGTVDEVSASVPYGSWPRQRVGIPVRARVEGKSVEAMVWFSVHRWMEVPVYMRDARPGERLDQVDMRLERRDMAGQVGTPVPAGEREAGSGLELRRAVSAGQPAMQLDTRPVRDVSRHEVVGLTVRRGAVALSTRAVAQGDGVV